MGLAFHLTRLGDHNIAILTDSGLGKHSAIIMIVP